MRPRSRLAALCVVAALALCASACDSSRAQDPAARAREETAAIRTIQKLFPQPMPGIVMFDYEDGRAEVVFMKESRQYFGSREQIGAMMETVMKSSFESVPALENMRIIVPFDGEIVMRHTTRSAIEDDGREVTVDTVRANR